MRPTYTILAVFMALVLFGGLWLLSSKSDRMLAASDTVPTTTHPYVEISRPAGFVNTDAIRIGDLVGKKVILVEFLTYSCINCQRTFPYATSWYEKYRDEGFEIIGIHTPEFAFEKDINNVRSAMQQFGIEYPIVLDNDYATWNAYGNKYWPRKYLIDINGNIVYDHIGEGGYEETEAKIRELLKERASVLGVEPGSDTVAGEDAVIAPVITEANSPETYFGSARNELLGNGQRKVSGTQTFALPTVYAPNTLYLGGTWNLTPEYARAAGAVRVVYRYDAGKVYMVASAATPTSVTVRIDGTVTKTIVVHDEQLYTLVDDVRGVHTLELQTEEGGLTLYTFTFG